LDACLFNELPPPTATNALHLSNQHTSHVILRVYRRIAPLR
jgi:hypothetical protein